MHAIPKPGNLGSAAQPTKRGDHESCGPLLPINPGTVALVAADAKEDPVVLLPPRRCGAEERSAPDRSRAHPTVSKKKCEANMARNGTDKTLVVARDFNEQRRPASIT